MEGKITLITPPDIFENLNFSILFLHLSDQDQDIISKFLSTSTVKENLNFYVYSGEQNLEWLFYALNRADLTYIDLDNCNYITDRLSSYILAKYEVFYKTDDENLVAIFNHINQNRITNIEQLLERVSSEQTI